MRRTLTLSTCAALLTLTGCASTAKPASSDAAPTAATTTAPAAPAAAAVTASTAMTKLAGLVHAAKLTNVVTEDNDANNLIGRPHEYTSKVQFSDTRVPTADTTGLDKGDVEYGGAIEVFASPADAATRAKYIQAVTAALPSAAEYDYVNGDVLIRVSHLLKPSQAKDYETAAQQIG